MKKDKKLIRNSTAEFLIYTRQAGDNDIEVRIQDNTIWLTEKMIAELFSVDRSVVNKHITNIYEDTELDENSTRAKFAQVQKEGNREVSREMQFYNLDMIISIGYRVNSLRATEFRRWATKVLNDYITKGYVIDKKRLIDGSYLSEEYYQQLIEEIRDIRSSERKFYQKITDIYATSIDYNKESEITKEFYKTVQNKLHYAVHGNTAAEVLMYRANSEKENMGLTSWKNSPDGKIIKSDVVIAKNYLNKKELETLNRFVTMYLDYAENQAEKHIPMSMEDWKVRLDAFLKFNEYEILNNPGKVSHEIASTFALSQFEKYQIIQDKLFESDFDKLINEDLKKLK